MTQEQKDLFKKEYKRLSHEDKLSCEDESEFFLQTISNLEDEQELSLPFAFIEIGARNEFDVVWHLMAVRPNKETKRLEILANIDTSYMTCEEFINEIEKLEKII